MASPNAPALSDGPGMGMARRQNRPLNSACSLLCGQATSQMSPRRPNPRSAAVCGRSIGSGMSIVANDFWIILGEELMTQGFHPSGPGWFSCGLCTTNKGSSQDRTLSEQAQMDDYDSRAGQRDKIIQYKAVGFRQFELGAPRRLRHPFVGHALVPLNLNGHVRNSTIRAAVGILIDRRFSSISIVFEERASSC